MHDYRIVYRARAIKEFIQSIDWYNERSVQASNNFITSIKAATLIIQNNPYLSRNSYKHFYEIKTKEFPFSIVYFINEEKKVIVITSIFHQKRNPGKKFT